MNAKTIISLLLMLFVSCNDKRQNFDKAIIPVSTVNFSKVNSTYDDYNSDLSISWCDRSFSLLFSTNRASGGTHFDFILYSCKATGDLVTGMFDMSAEWKRCGLADSINSTFNELGPYFTYDFSAEEFHRTESETGRLFYTSDIKGNNDIYYCYYEADEKDMLPIGKPVGLSGLNSDFDDGYMTIHPNETANRETVYFTSNRDNNFDIYHAVSGENKLINQQVFSVNKVEKLSSIADDKCPYISNDMIVFTSNRNGGFGGFDLWFSMYDGNEWSEPVNFGKDINSQYNEYRPIIISTDKDGFLNDLMIFSSDRPGGKGGFDLYYTGLNRRN
ncbi:MAG TPA: hypothetical protein DEO60_01235 [Bacteroidales bacterium]|jgi:hypothetical protein|nr:hypothetical protein [Bacteroidales bacterium]HBZ19725.1 hypothetical protein [Bacteroidales bacterium]